MCSWPTTESNVRGRWRRWSDSIVQSSITTAWAGGWAADKTRVETQTPHPLSLGTRYDARAALARAFEEAAVMPGTLLPHEILTELAGVAHDIVDEVASAPDGAFGYGFDLGHRAGPAAYNV